MRDTKPSLQSELFAWKPRLEFQHQTYLTEVNKCKIEMTKTTTTTTTTTHPHPYKGKVCISAQRSKLKESTVNSGKACTSQRPGFSLNIVHFAIPESAQSKGWYMPVLTSLLLGSLKYLWWLESPVGSWLRSGKFQREKAWEVTNLQIFIYRNRIHLFVSH